MAEKAVPVVERLAASGADATELWTSAGEMWQDLDRPARAAVAFDRILDPGPREPSRILDLATVYWDYGRTDEAEKVIRDGRTRIGKPSLHAFEAGVLREEKKDIDGALTEYLSAMDGDRAESDGYWYPEDYRAQRRMVQLLGRQRVLSEVEKRIRSLKPGVEADERRFLPLLYLLNLSPEGEEDSYDDWIEMPNDPVGREGRTQKRDQASPAQQRGIEQIGELLLARTMEMVPAATNRSFIRSVRGFQTALLNPRWAKDSGASSRLENAFLEREAMLMPTEEERIEKELARVNFFVTRNQPAEARQVMAKLETRLGSMGDSGLKIRTLATLARTTERLGGNAGDAFRALTDKYPWSLGVVEDRAEFCFRNNRNQEGLDVIEKAAASAAAGHKEKLSERLVKESLERGDIPRAKKALSALLEMKLDPALRISGVGLMGRLSFRENPSFDAIAFAKTEAAKLPDDVRPDLWATLARAARQETKGKASIDLWIEAINRRTLREWVIEASQSASQFQIEPTLLKFFESQRARSPRDARWAVAVRELRTQSGDLPGAIAAAKDVCGIAPEKENYWRDAVTLFERAGQFTEAATFLEGWANSRKADEKVASWRASLMVRGGQLPKAIEIEKGALEAFKREAAQNQSPEDVQSELEERTARVARRFLERNRPLAAWALATPGGKLSRANEVPLEHSVRTEIALRTGNLIPLVKAYENDKEFLEQAASTISEMAHPEDLTALQDYLLTKLFPAGGPPSDPALKKFDQFARDSGLHRWDEALARGLVTRVPGAWGANPPIDFLKRISPTAMNPLRFAKPNLDRAWIQYLVSRDDVPALNQAISSRLQSLDAFVSGTSPGPPPLDSSLFPVEALVQVAQAPDGAPVKTKISGWFRTKESYSRLAQAAVRVWDFSELLKLLDEEALGTWLLHNGPGKRILDPVDQRRWQTEVETGKALSALLDGQAGALQAPGIVRLRGPRSVGDLLGSDPKWTWPEFEPRPSDQGDQAIFGAGAEKGRTPGQLWGGRPGDAWYVLEAVARYREKDPKAPYVPLEAAPRGNEADRTLLGVRTAEGLLNLPLALSLDETYSADLAKADRLDRRARLLIASGADGKARAEDLLRKEVVKQQGTASETIFRQWEGISSRLGLTAPGDLLDAAKPVSSPLLAYLLDVSDLKRFTNLRPANAADLKTALANRWYGSQNALSKEELDYYLTELWTAGSASFPARGIARIEKMWPEAIEFLAGVGSPYRAAALAAVKTLPDPKPVSAVIDQSGDRREAAQFLLFRAELASGAVDQAITRAKRITGDSEAAASLTLTPAVLSTSSMEEEEVGGEEGSSRSSPAAPAVSSRLRNLLRVARAAKNPAGLAETERYLRELVKKRLEAGNQAADEWILAVELAPAAEVRLTVSALERAWIRGDYFSFGDETGIAKALVPKDENAARAWLARMEAPTDIQTARQRSDLHVLLKRPEDAHREWIEARAYLKLSRQEETQAFDAWRRLPAPKAGVTIPASPDAWQKAATFWRKPAADLDPGWGESFAAHLHKYPYDKLAARNVLRSLAPAREAFVTPAVAALGTSQDVAAWRVARYERTRSAVAARNALPSLTVDVNSLRSRRFLKTEIEGLLSDLARIGAATGSEPLLAKATSGLDSIKPGSSRALQPELTALRLKQAEAASRFPSFSLRNGLYAPIRPRDLTWNMYANVLNLEKVP
jgi:hypothetical protein